MTASIAVNPGVTFHLTIKLDPEKVEAFLAALRPCWLAVCQEPECLYFDIFRSQQEPHTFRFIEVWAKDNAWFETYQLPKDYYKTYWADTESMVISKQTEIFDRVQGWSLVAEDLRESSMPEKATLGRDTA